MYCTCIGHGTHIIWLTGLMGVVNIHFMCNMLGDTITHAKSPITLCSVIVTSCEISSGFISYLPCCITWYVIKMGTNFNIAQLANTSHLLHQLSKDQGTICFIAAIVGAAITTSNYWETAIRLQSPDQQMSRATPPTNSDMHPLPLPNWKEKFLCLPMLYKCTCMTENNNYSANSYVVAIIWLLAL